jgi:hypothetical protein
MSLPENEPSAENRTSQYGRMRLVLARRISRGLTIAVSRAAKARAAYDLWRTSHA